ncbi:emp24/gp25L/p24 family/GOLD-domain-containing protein [Pseudomassariella vexata]|uniref:Emp24/gp25L/p24 family/GOLD-domain-containing protein n=1 Tax=Pseudomassariella vexata TaxID=1141098 RepID=A0A1Y2E1J4_9PEZI|nr:emp24/gp25L/p24 family/GOLD-domain-containing protein [Pseudomassariella vexata]ORY65423.1 emp24/gp25L/p24 family/GOLD-domain-containing protein [Pseudomassariella vexata]
MAPARSLLQYVCSIVLLISSVHALKFDLIAQNQHDRKPERCIRNFVAKDTLVVVTAIVGGQKRDGMTVNMNIKDAVGNEYGRGKDIVGEHRQVFTSHADAAFDVCFENLRSGTGRPPADATRHVELDIDIGADAKDWSAIQANEKLKPLEAELRRVEEMIQEIVSEMDYLRSREQKLRDTNESTNTRVKWFGIGTTMLLIGLWGWQIMYLRAYFRSKHLI